MNEYENMTKEEIIAKYEVSCRETVELYEALRERDEKLTELYSKDYNNKRLISKLKNQLAVLESKYAQAIDFINDYELGDNFNIYTGDKK